MVDYWGIFIKRCGVAKTICYLLFVVSCYCLYSIQPYVLPQILSIDRGNVYVNFQHAIILGLSFMSVPLMNYPNNYAMQIARKYSKQILFEDLLKKKYDYFFRHDTGMIQNLISEISFCVRNIIHSSSEFIFRYLAIILINFLAFRKASLSLAILYVFSYCLYFFVSIVLSKKHESKIKNTLASASKANAFLIDYCQNIETVYSCDSFKKEMGNYEKQLEFERRSYFNHQIYIDNAKMFQHVLLIFICFAQLVCFILTVNSSEMSISFYLAMVYSIFNLRDFGGEFLALTEFTSRMKNALSMLGYGNDLREKETETETIDSLIDLKNITFSYGDRKIFDSFNLKVEPGKKIAIYGSNGSGKSTLMKMVANLLEIDSGVVKRSCINNGMMYISQSSNLFNRSIYENMVYPSSTADKDEIWRLIKKFDLDSLICSEEDLYQKTPGDFGKTFSGGEKQKILIIRALINKPSLILFDEITSALDVKSTKIFLEKIQTEFRDSTILYISHNPKEAKYFDEVINISE